MKLTFKSFDGISVELVKLYTRGTYYGTTVNSKAVLSAFLLDVPRNSFVPLDWNEYSSMSYDLQEFLTEGVLPEVVCVGLFTPKDISIGEVAIIIWFQDDFFEDPSKVLTERIAKMRWGDISVVADLLS